MSLMKLGNRTSRLNQATVYGMEPSRTKDAKRFEVMASRRRSGGEGASGEEGEDAVGDAFHQVAQGLLRVQEALRLQEQEAERRAQEALRLQEQRAAAALREAVRQMAKERDEAIRALRGELSARMERVEERMNEIEERMVASARRKESEETGGERALQQLETRMGNLEAAVQRALSNVFPRVEALVAQLEETPLRPPPAPPSPSTAAYTSTSPHPPASSAPGATATAGAAAGARKETVAGHQGAAADDEETAKQRVELRVREVMARRDRALAAPSSLGEDLCEAAFEGQVEDVRRLLDSGANVNYNNSNGDFPLIKAVRGDRWQSGVVSLLLERGADVNAIDVDGWTALHFAALGDVSSRMVALLGSAGADMDARDVIGATPLHEAALTNNETGVRALLAAGARKSLRGWGGIMMNKTPFDLADSVVFQDLLRP